MATNTHGTSPRRAGLAIAAVLALAATVFVASPAAAGPTFCLLATDNTNSMVVHLDESPNNTTTLRMIDDTLLVNGVPCGSLVPSLEPPLPSIAIVEEGDPKNDTVVFDLSTPFQVQGQHVFVNVFLSSGDVVEVRGHENTDLVRLEPDELVVNSGEGIRLLAELDNSTDITLDINLLGGPDTFEMIRDGGAWWNNGPVIVKGGSGDDVLRGGPKRQTLTGGTGNDTLRGKGGPDVLNGGGGADDIAGGGGGDEINGNGGPDTIAGGGGRDEIKGNGGADEISGGGGRDTVFGNKGPDTFTMNDGRNDTVNGGGGRDTCRCDNGDATKSIAVFT